MKQLEKTVSKRSLFRAAIADQLIDRVIDGFASRLQNPVLLVPYCYHMYSAILAGGQIIRKMVKKSFSLTDEQGLNTFEYNAKSRMVSC